MRLQYFSFVFVFVFWTMLSSSFAGQVSIMGENDVTAHTDHYFTHGTRFQYADNDNWGIAIGQNMYTPDDKKATYLVPDDRPYAGYLYGSGFYTYYLASGDEFFTELQMGMVGPDSYAEQTQIWVHEHIHSALPMGWDNQIANHFAVLLMNKYTTHILSSKYFSIDPYVGSQVGNLADNLNAGVNVYLGYNLPPNRNQQRMIPFKAVMGDNGGWNPYAYLYAGVEPRLVMYSMLLEDRRFTIHPETYVYDENAGLVLGCKYFELAFTLCIRSREFDEQPEPEKYGAAKISFGF